MSKLTPNEYVTPVNTELILETFHDAGGTRIEFVGSEPLAQHEELIASVSAEHVMLTNGTLQPARDLLQSLVTNPMTQTVVDFLEPIEVQQHHRRRPDLLRTSISDVLAENV